jgi:hypothetical protein
MKIFIDIETVPSCAIRQDYTVDMDEETTELYLRRFKSPIRELSLVKSVSEMEALDRHYIENAALYAEFGKVACVSMAYIHEGQITMKSFCSGDERKDLEAVSVALNKATTLVAHNGKDFDYPFLCRRMIALGIPLPGVLQIQNKKPWDIPLEDTMDMWRFGQFKHSVSLATLCKVFGLQSPKQNMSGDSVWMKYYIAKDLHAIEDYCAGDVVALVNVYRKMQYLEPILKPSAV